MCDADRVYHKATTSATAHALAMPESRAGPGASVDERWAGMLETLRQVGNLYQREKYIYFQPVRDASEACYEVIFV